MPYSTADHVSSSLAGKRHISMEGWDNTGNLVAFCHIDYANPTQGEVLNPDIAAHNRLSVDPFLWFS